MGAASCCCCCRVLGAGQHWVPSVLPWPHACGRKQAVPLTLLLAQVLLFHEEAAEAASEEALVELADWAARGLAWLASGEAREHAAWKGEPARVGGWACGMRKDRRCVSCHHTPCDHEANQLANRRAQRRGAGGAPAAGRAAGARGGGALCGGAVRAHHPALPVRPCAQAVAVGAGPHREWEERQAGSRACMQGLGLTGASTGAWAAPALCRQAASALAFPCCALIPPLARPRTQVSTNDTPMALLPLLDRPPWVRRGRGGALERFSAGAWAAVEPAERHRVGQQDGQVGVVWGAGSGLPLQPAASCLQAAGPQPMQAACAARRARPALQAWLLLHNLLLDPAARAKMDVSEARADALLRARRHLSEPLLDQVRPLAVLVVVGWGRESMPLGRHDLSSCHPLSCRLLVITRSLSCTWQLPPLRALQRLLDELAFGVSSQQPAATPARLIVEQVPRGHESAACNRVHRCCCKVFEDAAECRLLGNCASPSQCPYHASSCPPCAPPCCAGETGQRSRLARQRSSWAPQRSD